MKDDHFRKVSMVFLLALSVAIVGCFCSGGCVPTEKYERTVHLSAPLQAGGSFEGRTHNGSINLTGAGVTDCDLTATIVACAMTQEDAKKLAEAVEVKLMPFGGKLTAKIEKPKKLVSKYVTVDLEATVPDKTDVELSTHNGAVEILNITGQINATTHNGSVSCKEVSGQTRLESHNGSVVCEGVTGDVELKTHNGDIQASYTRTAPAVCNISVVSHNGSVELICPQDFSAKVEASTHNGSIETDLPITVVGKVTSHKLQGTIGAGDGKLHLETHNGSIEIRKQK